MKPSLIVSGLFAMLSACGPGNLPPPDPNVQQQAAPTDTTVPVAPPPTDMQQRQAKLEAEKYRIEQEEAQLKAQQQAQTSTAPPPPPPPQAQAVPAQPVCLDCGVVASITPIKREGKAGWLGTLGGAAAGGLVGNQFGSGKGNTAMTVLGVVGGAFAGREVQRRVDTKTAYRVTVNMDNGNRRTVYLDRAGGLARGSRVRVSGKNLLPY